MPAVAVHRLVFEVHRAELYSAEETFFCDLHYIVTTSFESSHGFLYDLGTTHEAISGGKIPALLILSIFISIFPLKLEMQMQNWKNLFAESLSKG